MGLALERLWSSRSGNLLPFRDSSVSTVSARRGARPLQATGLTASRPPGRLGLGQRRRRSHSREFIARGVGSAARAETASGPFRFLGSTAWGALGHAGYSPEAKASASVGRP